MYTCTCTSSFVRTLYSLWISSFENLICITLYWFSNSKLQFFSWIKRKHEISPVLFCPSVIYVIPCLIFICSVNWFSLWVKLRVIPQKTKQKKLQVTQSQTRSERQSLVSFPFKQEFVVMPSLSSSHSLQWRKVHHVRH